jgi:hypothetical protein
MAKVARCNFGATGSTNSIATDGWRTGGDWQSTHGDAVAIGDDTPRTQRHDPPTALSFGASDDGYLKYQDTETLGNGAMTPAESSLRSGMVAYRLHASHDPKKTTAAARATFLSRFEREVDPDGVLQPDERRRRAAAARKAYFQRVERSRRHLRIRSATIE